MCLWGFRGVLGIYRVLGGFVWVSVGLWGFIWGCVSLWGLCGVVGVYLDLCELVWGLCGTLPTRG